MSFLDYIIRVGNEILIESVKFHIETVNGEVTYQDTNVCLFLPTSIVTQTVNGWAVEWVCGQVDEWVVD